MMDKLGGFIMGAIFFAVIAYVALIAIVGVVAAVVWLAVGVMLSAAAVTMPATVLALLAIRLRSVDLRQAWYRLQGADVKWLLLLALLAFPAYVMGVKLHFVDYWPQYVFDDMAGFTVLAWVNLGALGVLGVLMIYDVLVPYVRYRQALRETPDFAARHLRSDHSINLDAIAEDAPSLRVFGRPRQELTRAFKTRLSQAARALRIPLPSTSVDPTYATEEARDLGEAVDVVTAYGEYAHSAGERELERQTEAKLDELRRSGVDILRDDR